jgi:hypothetical protein
MGLFSEWGQELNSLDFHKLTLSRSSFHLILLISYNFINTGHFIETVLLKVLVDYLILTYFYGSYQLWCPWYHTGLIPSSHLVVSFYSPLPQAKFFIVFKRLHSYPLSFSCHLVLGRRIWSQGFEDHLCLDLELCPSSPYLTAQWAFSLKCQFQLCLNCTMIIRKPPNIPCWTHVCARSCA